MSGIIYHLFCTVTGKAYVGQTWQGLDQRWKDHRAARSKCRKLNAAIRKYGSDAFVCSVLTQGLMQQEDMDAAEKYWIEYFDTIKNGYNIREAGSSGRLPLETRIKISQSLVGNTRPLGYCHSREARENMGRAHLGNKNSLGNVPSEASRVNRSRTQGGRPFTDQTGHRYETLRGAAQSLGLDPSNVSAVLKGRRKSIGGYTFQYVE